jgi:chromosome segregation ATPase
MTNEEMQATMQFILKQQESIASNLLQVSIRLEELARAQAETAARQDKLQAQQDKFQSQLDTLTQASLGLVHLVADWTKKVTTLTEAQERTDAKIAQLAEAQAHTEARLDAFINVVERYISEGRQGKS